MGRPLSDKKIAGKLSLRRDAARYSIVLTIVLVSAVLISIGIDFWRPGLRDSMANHAKLPAGSSRQNVPLFYMAVLEDHGKILTFADIVQPEQQAAFRHLSDPLLKYGQSDSAFWVKLTPAEPGLVLSVFNPTVQHLTVYEPGQTTSWGWGDPDRDRSDLFFYPVVRLESTQTVYLRMHSSYIQSYELRVETAEASERHRLMFLMTLAILFGILLALLITHFIYYLRNREPIQIAFSAFILSNLFYQFSLMGIFRILSDPWGSILTSRVGSLGLFLTVTIAFFSQYSLKQTKVARATEILTLLSVSLGLIGAMTGLTGVSRSFAQLTSLIGLSLMLTIEVLILVAARHHYHQIKAFFWGWSLVVLGVILHTFRTQGILPNNEWTVSITLTTATVQSIVFSAGVTRSVAELRERAILSENAFLRAQIKPHFIYNTLNTVAFFIQKDIDQAVRLLADFSAFLRSNFDFESSNQLVSIDQELSVVKTYLSIEKVRFGDRLQSDISCDPALQNVQIPSLIIQPLVENALRHGILARESGGRISVRIERAGQDVLLIIEDDGIGMTAEQLDLLNHYDGSPQQKSDGRISIGLQNIRQRLKAFHKSQLKIESHLHVGTIVHIRFRGQAPA